MSGRRPTRFDVSRWTGPDRPADWRHRFAAEIHARGVLAHPRMDKTIARLARFYVRRDGCRTSRDYRLLRRRTPDECRAVELHENWQHNGTAHLLEASILAQETLRGVAERTGVAKDTIDFYLAAFFDVKNRLHRRDFILAEVIGPVDGGPGRVIYYRALKTFAFLCGSPAIDLFTLEPPRHDHWFRPSELLRRLAQRADLLRSSPHCKTPTGRPRVWPARQRPWRGSVRDGPSRRNIRFGLGTSWSAAWGRWPGPAPGFPVPCRANPPPGKPGRKGGGP